MNPVANTLLPPQIVKNRVFNCKMRSKYYEKAFYNFRKVQGYVASKVSVGEFDYYDFLTLFKFFADDMSSCLNYAKNAIYLHKRGKLPSYAKDRKYGLLKEEIILMHILQKLHNLSQHIIDFVKINMHLDELSDELTTVQSTNRAQQGFAKQLYESLQNISANDQQELQRFIENMADRYNLGNRLFSFLQELQRF